MTHVSVIIPVAGQGKRFGGRVPKQFLPLLGESVIYRTVRKFLENENVQSGVVVGAESELAVLSEILENLAGFNDMFQIVAGGAERQDSVYNGLQQVSPKTEIVLVHDGVRPLIPNQLINAVIEKAVQNGACIVAVPVKDTIKKVHDHRVVETLPRSELWQVQTPQACKFQWLKAAHDKAREKKFYSTDEAALLEWAGFPVSVTMGEYTNIKITTSEDLHIAESILKAKS